MTDNTPLIQVKNLKKYFRVNGGAMLHAVDDVSFEIPKGKTLGVVGESGCGKSTLGKSILRLVEPTSGDVLLNGESIMGLNKREMRDIRSKMQIVFQDPYSSLDPRMTVVESIAEYMIAGKVYKHRSDAYNRAAEIMDTVGLARRYANSYPHELDGGRRQRVGIARALSMEPEFIVCDEPVSALDVSIQAQILNLLMDLQEDRGLTYMFITHDLSVVKHISDEIMVMYLGKCVEKANADELFDNPLHPYTKALLSAIPEPDISMRSKPIIAIQGEVTSPINPKDGCRFVARCGVCSEDCKTRNPEMRYFGDDHCAACGHINNGEN